MPKILDGLRERLLAAARRQIEYNGYQNMTIRSVATECGIAVGTVYNYFPSKEILIASFLSEDWHACIDPIAAQVNDDARTHLRCIFDALHSFANSYRELFSDTEAQKVYHMVFAHRHKQLRDQIASLILPLCGEAENREFLSEFIAEALLTWTREEKPFEDIYAVINRLIKNESEE